MKLTIHQGCDCVEPEIELRCRFLDHRLKKMTEYIRQYTICLKGFSEKELYHIPLEQICYMEAVGKKTFLYLKDQVLESPESLIRLEPLLFGTPVVRISKSCLINTDYLRSVRALVNHRMEATLTTGEKLIISRTYIPSLLKKLEGSETSSH